MASTTSTQVSALARIFSGEVPGAAAPAWVGWAAGAEAETGGVVCVVIGAGVAVDGAAAPEVCGGSAGTLAAACVAGAVSEALTTGASTFAGGVSVAAGAVTTAAPGPGAVVAAGSGARSRCVTCSIQLDGMAYTATAATSSTATPSTAGRFSSSAESIGS